MYLSATERLICRREISLIGSTSFGFAQNTIHDFQKNRIELIVVLSSTNARKIQSGSQNVHHFNMIFKRARAL